MAELKQVRQQMLAITNDMAQLRAENDCLKQAMAVKVQEVFLPFYSRIPQVEISCAEHVKLTGCRRAGA